MPHRKLFSLTGIAFFVVCIGVVVWVLTRPNPLVSGARNMAIAMRDGDAETMYSFTIPDERACSDLTQEKIRKVWQILIQPLVSSSRLVGEGKATLESNKTQGTAIFHFLDKSNNPWDLDAISNQTDDGPKESIIYWMLATASLFDDDGQAQSTLTTSLALKGVHRYRAKLEAVGITRLMLAPGRCVTWDQLEALLHPPAKE
jgi:hypothetical protein